MDTLNRYFKDIRKSKPLSPDREKELALAVQGGNEEALQELVEANLRFVITEAKKYQGRGLSLEDLICEGNVGLIEAAKRFDPSAGFRFISYAVFWIRQAILFALSSNRNIRLPLNRVGDLNAARKVKEEYASRGETISDREVAHQVGISLEELGTLQRAGRSVVSLDLKVGDDEDNSLESIIKGEGQDIDADLYKESLCDSLLRVLRSVLTEKEASIVAESYGVGCEVKSEEEIGEKWGISGERVRQIKLKAIAKIRKSSKALNCLREYLG